MPSDDLEELRAHLADEGLLGRARGAATMAQTSEPSGQAGQQAHVTRPLLLDLFCGQGGASAGYVDAGFGVVGVDIAPQPRYPYEFHQGDALLYLAGLVVSGEIARFSAIHASPPCQEYSALKSLKTRRYADLLAPTRDMLIASGLPWILENVERAPMAQGVMLCGTALGIPVRRHRLFDSSHLLYPPGPCRHTLDDVNVYGHSAWNYRPRAAEWKLQFTRTNAKQCPVSADEARRAFEAPWMTQAGLAESIPPAYTAWLGRQLLTVVEAGKVA